MRNNIEEERKGVMVGFRDLACNSVVFDWHAILSDGRKEVLINIRGW